MPNTKKISQPWSETGKTVYTIIRREADLYLINDASGAFANAPADPYILLTEDGTIKGLYELSEARAAWNDGNYFIFIYRQTGATPVPASDMMIGSSKMEIVSDTEVDSSAVITIDTVVDLIEDILRNKMKITDLTGTTILYADNSSTELYNVVGMITDDATTTTRLRLA